MANIIQFPQKPINDWPVFEAGITDVLVEGGVDVAVQKRIIEKIKSLYEMIDFSITFEFGTVSINASTTKDTIDQIVRDTSSQILGKVETQLSDYLIMVKKKILTERAIREIEVCRELGLLKGTGFG